MEQLSIDDQMAIAQTLSKYGILLDTQRVEAWSDLFEPDGVVEIDGRAPISTEIDRRALVTDSPRGAHISTPPVISTGASSSEATSEQTFLFFNIGSGKIRTGWYEDELVKRGTRWTIRRRVIHFFASN